ncbi:hypothetical protein GOODEAATRI_012505 [Goodea atripinnis]|uniref:Chemokine interleukin-8-like domain-containing protein n=1 Tax=Goodea atripinnis TaxID=208336 RepID=A0ABV0PDH6_9TELE
MPLNLQTVCQFTLLSLCCLLTAVRKTDSTYVPGRCLCPKSETGVRGKLTDLKIYPKSATCSNITVIVTLKRNNVNVCLNPEAALGKQLIRCWNR